MSETEALRRRVEDLAAAVRWLADAAELFAVEHRSKLDGKRALGWIDDARALSYEETAE